MIYCERCKKIKKVVDFNKDDPILSCGHQKTCENRTDSIESYMIQEAIRDGESLLTIKRKCFEGVLKILEDCEEKPTVGECKTCGTVTVHYDPDGIPRCGGDMILNPGCGMPVQMKHEYKEIIE